LHLKAPRLNIREVNFRVLCQADHVGVIELHFRSRARTGLNRILDHHRGILGSRHVVSGVAAANGNIPIQKTDSRNTGTTRRGILIPTVRRTGRWLHSQ
jgi:hypothetical protein